MRKMDIVVSRFTCWACRMRFNSSGVFKIEYRAALRPPHRVVSLAASQCGFLKGPVGIFYKCDYVAHMQTGLNNPPRAHSWKIEFPSQTLSLSNFRATRAQPNRTPERKSKEKFSNRQFVGCPIIRVFLHSATGWQIREQILISEH